MTPKQKAKRLRDAMYNAFVDETEAKRCALIAVDEILTYHDSLFECGLKNVHQTFETPTEIYNDVMNPKKDFWQQVRKEIENL